MIPDRERGYSIEPDTLIVHERYQDHAPRAMRTSAFGVSEYAKGRELIPCEVCFPAPKPAKVKGGRITTVQPVVVGEKGPERFVGRIKPEDLYFEGESVPNAEEPA